MESPDRSFITALIKVDWEQEQGAGEGEGEGGRRMRRSRRQEMEKEHPLQGQDQEKRQEHVKESVDRVEEGYCRWNMGAGAAGAAGHE